MTDYIFQEYYRQYERDFAASDYLANETTDREYLEFGEHVKATLDTGKKR